MAKDDKFEAPAEQKLITDADKLKQAAAAPQVACPFCGTRNDADAKACKKCGGDLSGAEARAKGEVVGAFTTAKAPEVKCPFCGTPNPSGAGKCKKCGGTLGRVAVPPPKPAAAAPKATGFGAIVIGLVAVLCVGAVILFALGGRTSDAAATVQSVSWERAVPILAQAPVKREGWRDQAPAGSQVGQCEERVRGTSDEAVERSRKVCGTPYTIDQGTGAGKVVQDCAYQVLDDWCAYTVLQWTVVDAVVARGADLNPRWPDVSLAGGQREGDRTEEFKVVFLANDSTFTYRPDTEQEFQKYVPGSRWTIKVNGFGAVTDAQPAK
jgi:ribosomal protein L40E